MPTPIPKRTPPPLGDEQLLKLAKLVAALKAQGYTKEQVVEYVRQQFGMAPAPKQPEEPSLMPKPGENTSDLLPL